MTNPERAWTAGEWDKSGPELLRLAKLVLKGIKQGAIEDQTLLDFSKAKNSASIPMMPLSEMLETAIKTAEARNALSKASGTEMKDEKS